MKIEKEFIKFVEIMIDDILNKLEGSHPTFKRIDLPDKPSKIIVLGTLGDKSTDYSPETLQQERTLSSVKNNSLAVRFLTSTAEGKLGITPSFSLYYRVYPTFQEQTTYVKRNYDNVPEKVEIAKIWKRKDITIDEIVFNISENSREKEIHFDNIIQSILDDNEIFTGGDAISSESLKDEESYLAYIATLKTNRHLPFNWKAKILIKKESFPHDDRKLNLLTVYFLNETEEDKKYETFLFNCHLKIKLYEMDIQPFKHTYEYEGFKQHYETLLRCLNCHATYDNSSLTVRLARNWNMFPSSI